MSDKINHRTDRWSDFLSRESVGLALAGSRDSVALRFRDEVFARIYTGDEPLSPAVIVDKRFSAWAAAYHRALSNSPTFARIVSQAKGSALRSAIAIDAILKNLKPEPEESTGQGGESDQPNEDETEGEDSDETGGEGGESDDESEESDESGEGGGEGSDGEGEEGDEDDGETGSGDSESDESGEQPGEGSGSKGGDEDDETDGDESPKGGDEQGEGEEEDGGGEQGKGGEGGEEEQDGSPDGAGFGEGDDAGEDTGSGEVPEVDAGELENLLKGAAKEAEAEMDAVEEAVENLSGAGVRTDSQGEVVPGDVAKARELAKQLTWNDSLKRIVDLAGKFKLIAAQKRAAKTIGGRERTVGVENGNDLTRLLPTEIARLADDDLSDGFFMDWAEKRTLQFRKESTLRAGHGPVVVVLDKSASMAGLEDEWQTAIALAMLDHAKKQRRTFAVIGFAGSVRYTKIVKPNEPMPIDSIIQPANGGSTNIHLALNHALSIIADEQKKGGKLAKADVILITDGQSYTGSASEIRARAEKLDTSIIALGIGVPSSALAPWTNDYRSIENLTKVDDATAEALFVSKDERDAKAAAEAKRSKGKSKKWVKGGRVQK